VAGICLQLQRDPMSSRLWAQHHVTHQYLFQTGTGCMWAKQSVCGGMPMVCELHPHSTACSSVTFVTFPVKKQAK